MIRLHHIPRVQLAVIGFVCAAALALTTNGVIGMYRDADAKADQLAHAPQEAATPAAPVQSRELEALRDLFTYCQQQTSWSAPPCATSPQNTGTLTTVQRAPADGSDDSRVEVTVKAGAGTTAAPTPAKTTAPKPTPTKKVTPSPNSGGQSPGRGRNGNGAGHGKAGAGGGQKGR